MWFDPMSFDPRSLYHMSFDPKSFDPMSVTPRELMLTDKAKVEARNLTFSKGGGQRENIPHIARKKFGWPLPKHF